MMIPFLPAGPATVMLRNKSTGSTVGPINIIVETPPPLSRPAEEIIDSALALQIDKLNELSDLLEGNNDFPLENLELAKSEINQVRILLQEISIDPTPEEEQYLIEMAVMIENSGFFTSIFE